MALSLAYTILAIGAITESKATDVAAVEKPSGGGALGSADAAPATATRADADVGLGGFVLGVVTLLGISLTLPILVVFGSLPSGLITGAIIAFGLQQAWRMIGTTALQVSGPFRIGADAVTTT